MTGSPPPQTVRRGLVIEGGGAKGAFAIGCLKAFRDRGINFDAIAGTSAGALCSLIWATDSLNEGERVWLGIGRSTFFGAKPDGCFRRLAKIVLTAGKLFATYVRNIELEGQPQYARDLVFSALLGLLYWLLLLGLIPTLWHFALFPIVVPLVGIFAFANQLPYVGWDTRVRRLLLDVLLWAATSKAVLGLAGLLLAAQLIGAFPLRASWAPTFVAAMVVLVLLIALDLRATLIEGKLLASHVRSFLAKPIRIPIYVTVAQEVEPGSPRFAIATPGVFASVYARLDNAPSELAEAFAYASGALPFGILPSLQIGENVFVDGGVADNMPVLPLLQHELDELWLIRLRPTAIDLKDHLRSVGYQQMLVHGLPAHGHELFESRLNQLRVVQIIPQGNLGGTLTGTLNFNERRSAALLRHGYRVASKMIDHPERPLRTYRPRFSLRHRVTFLLRAMPGCDLRRLFSRGSIDTLEPHDLREHALQLPNAVRQATRRSHSKPVKSAVTFSVGIVFVSLAYAAFHEGRAAAGSAWAAAGLWTLLVFPSWWPRFRRMQGF